MKNVEDLADRGDFTFYALNIRLGKATGDTMNTAFRAKIDMKFLLKDKKHPTVNMHMRVICAIMNEAKKECRECKGV